MRTKKTSTKKNSLKNGPTNKELVSMLDINISIAKGLLATLESGHLSALTKKLEKMEPEHLQILLQDVMEEIWSAEMTLVKLKSNLETKYAGICNF